jgi:hypothetical protein
VRTAQQFICKKCRSLVTIETLNHSSDGTPFCRCPKLRGEERGGRDRVTPSQPGLLPVTRLLD